jgi:hypothetical protein
VDRSLVSACDDGIQRRRSIRQLGNDLDAVVAVRHNASV